MIKDKLILKFRTVEDLHQLQMDFGCQKKDQMEGEQHLDVKMGFTETKLKFLVQIMEHGQSMKGLVWQVNLNCYYLF